MSRNAYQQRIELSRDNMSNLPKSINKKKNLTKQRRTKVTQTIQQLLGENLLLKTGFKSQWVQRSGSTAASVKSNYTLLKQIGFSDNKISKNLIMLTLPSETIKKSYNFFRELGVDNTLLIASPVLLSLNVKYLNQHYQNFSHIGLSLDSSKLAHIIRNNPCILFKKPSTIKNKIRFFTKKGVKVDKLAANVPILFQSSDALECRWVLLNKFGLSDKNIATNLHLLALSHNTLKKHYCGLRNYFEKGQISTFATLLGIPSTTVQANIQFLNFWGITPERIPMAYSTHPSTKRRKIAWIIKQILKPKYAEQDVSETVKKLRVLLNSNPKLLVYSLATLERKQDLINKRFKDLALS